MGGEVEFEHRDISLRYQTVRTSRMTFESEKIHEWMQSQLPADESATILNACAGETELAVPGEVIRNDIDPSIPADLHVDVATIDEYLPSDSVDVVIHDPPFSTVQSQETYGTGATTRYGDETLAAIRDVLAPGGTLIQWGYSPQLNPGFELEAAVLWNRIGRGHDFVATVQQYVPGTSPTAMTSYEKVEFNPSVDGVQGAASVGGNSGEPVGLTLSGHPSSGPYVQGYLEQFQTGPTLVITDGYREYQQFGDRRTVIAGLTESAPADTYVGVNSLSDVLPRHNFETVIVDVAPESFCWNCYYAPEATETGYVRALKLEAEQLLKKRSGQLIQVGQTATNAPADLSFVRDHVVLTASPPSTDLITPIISVDRRGTARLTGTRERFLPEQTFEKTARTAESVHTTEYGKFTHPPAYSVSCVECGAAPGEFCRTASGTNLPYGYVHEQRQATVDQRCPVRPPKLLTPARSSMTDPARPVSAGGEKSHQESQPPATGD